jgi:hypothetical protein
MAGQRGHRGQAGSRRVTEVTWGHLGSHEVTGVTAAKKWLRLEYGGQVGVTVVTGSHWGQGEVTGVMWFPEATWSHLGVIWGHERSQRSLASRWFRLGNLGSSEVTRGHRGHRVHRGHMESDRKWWGDPVHPHPPPTHTQLWAEAGAWTRCLFLNSGTRPPHTDAVTTPRHRCPRPPRPSAWGPRPTAAAAAPGPARSPAALPRPRHAGSDLRHLLAPGRPPRTPTSTRPPPGSAGAGRGGRGHVGVIRGHGVARGCGGQVDVRWDQAGIMGHMSPCEGSWGHWGSCGVIRGHGSHWALWGQPGSRRVGWGHWGLHRVIRGQGVTKG